MVDQNLRLEAHATALSMLRLYGLQGKRCGVDLLRRTGAL